jgi:hypothetical protein
MVVQQFPSNASSIYSWKQREQWLIPQQGVHNLIHLVGIHRKKSQYEIVHIAKTAREASVKLAFVRTSQSPGI